MKAIVYESYGSPNTLEVREIDKPIPSESEVLVKVHASTLNSADFDLLRGKIFSRFLGPIRPKYKVLGSDIAGVVEAVGSKVKGLKPGDKVFADLTEVGFGAFAQYRCVAEEILTLMPLKITFEEAAAMPSAGVIALQGIRSGEEIRSGQKVLINGAGGGMGTFAIQMAKSAGAQVTGVDTGVKLKKMLQIGADHVIDYTKEDYTKSGKYYDLILDCQACHSIFTNNRVLEPRGKYFMIGGSTGSILQVATIGPILSKKDGKQLGLLIGKPNRKADMVYLKELYETGKVKPIIDRVYPIDQIKDAMHYFEEGHFVGKIVINMG